MEQRGFVFIEENLSSPDVAVATFLARVPLAPSGIERVAIDDASGRILAERIAADDDYPNAPRSAMDGFAVRSSATPGRFAIAGEIAMGRAWPRPLATGTALRIPTGGVVPESSDAVVPVEDTRIEGGDVVVDGALRAGENVNARGGDMRAGEAVLEPGLRLRAAHLGVLATLGVTSVPVFVRPRLAVISSGDELVDPATRPQPGEVRDSNRFAIAGALRAMGALPEHYPTVPDTPGALEGALRDALEHNDGVVVSGGSSVGERDWTPSAVASLGEPGVVVHGLRVKPGKPTLLGALGRKPVIGLSGNPTSAVLILEAVLAPIVAAMTGGRFALQRVNARSAAPARSRLGWTWYVPVRLVDEPDGWTAHPLTLHSSSVSQTARADGFIVVPELAEEWTTGTSVTVYCFV